MLFLTFNLSLENPFSTNETVQLTVASKKGGYTLYLAFVGNWACALATRRGLSGQAGILPCFVERRHHIF